MFYYYSNKKKKIKKILCYSYPFILKKIAKGSKYIEIKILITFINYPICADILLIDGYLEAGISPITNTITPLKLWSRVQTKFLGLR